MSRTSVFSFDTGVQEQHQRCSHPARVSKSMQSF